jgi:hypothetical protein
MLIVYSAALLSLAILSPSQALALLPLPEEVAMEMAETVLMAVMAMVETMVMAETVMMEMMVMMEMAMEVDKPRSQTPPPMLSSLPSS